MPTLFSSSPLPQQLESSGSHTLSACWDPALSLLCWKLLSGGMPANIEPNFPNGNELNLVAGKCGLEEIYDSKNQHTPSLRGVFVSIRNLIKKLEYQLEHLEMPPAESH